MNPRRLHPLTPLARAVQPTPAIVLAVLLLGGASTEARIATALGAAVLVAGVAGGVSYLEWQRFSFHFDDSGDFRVDSGVIQHSHRKLQLSRLQSVEVTQPFFPRLFGLAEVTAEVAGGGESRVVLRYLEYADAQHLRNELIARAAGVEATTPAAPERVLTTVSNGTLLLSLLLRLQTLSLFVLTALLLTTAFLTGGFGALGVALVTGGVPAFQVFGEFMRRYGFTVADSPDGLRIRHGLTSTVANTVPPGRVHAVGFASGPIWRRLGWVRVMVDLGGNPRSGGGNDDAAGTTLLPVTTWATAREVVSHILVGVDVHDVDFEAVPRRARWRAPIQWGRVGVAVDDSVLMARRGRLEQWWTVVPHGRVQSLRVVQGPWQRSLGLASLHLDTVPGPVQVLVPHMDASRAREVAEAELDRARAARNSARPDRWMTG